MHLIKLKWIYYVFLYYMDFNDRIIYGSVEGRRRCRSKWIFSGLYGVFLAVKKTHSVIISVISTVVMLGIRVYKFGIEIFL